MQLMRIIAPVSPYISVYIGMAVLRNGWYAIIIYHLLTFAVMLLDSRYAKKQVALKAIKPRFLWWIIVYCLVGILLYLLLPLFAEPKYMAAELHRYGIHEGNWFYFAVYFCTVNSIMEELFWRGYLGESNKRLILNDLFFAGYHAYVVWFFAAPIWIIPTIAIVAFGAWLWRQLKTASGSLSLPLLTHFFADISILIAVHYRLFN